MVAPVWSVRFILADETLKSEEFRGLNWSGIPSELRAPGQPGQPCSAVCQAPKHVQERHIIMWVKVPRNRPPDHLRRNPSIT